MINGTKLFVTRYLDESVMMSFLNMDKNLIMPDCLSMMIWGGEAVL